MAPKREFLACGLSPEYLKRASERGLDVGVNTSDDVAARIEQYKADVAALKNTNIEIYPIDADEPEALENFKAKMKSKSWDGVSFGGGVRTLLFMEEFFENLINIAKDEAPKAKFVFPYGPQKVVPAFKRQFPDLS